MAYSHCWEFELVRILGEEKKNDKYHMESHNLKACVLAHIFSFVIRGITESLCTVQGLYM